VIIVENARLSEDPASAHLPDLVYDAAQLRHLDGYITNLLLRVRGSLVGSGSPGCPLYRVRCQDAWKVQRFAQCRLPSA